MTKKKLSIKTQFISLLSLGLLVFTLFTLIDLAGTKTKLYSKAFSNKNFGFAIKLENPSDNQSVENISYIRFDGNLFTPQKGYTLETMFKPLIPEFPSKYVFSYQQDDSPLALLVSSYPTDGGFYDLTYQAFVGDDSNGNCVRQSQLFHQKNLYVNQVMAWHKVAITMNERGDWKLFVDGKASPESGTVSEICEPGGYFLVGAGKDTVAPFPMEVDELRISNISRYEENYNAGIYPFEKDSYTLALFDFNKNLTSKIDSGFRGEMVGSLNYVKNLYPKK